MRRSSLLAALLLAAAGPAFGQTAPSSATPWFKSVRGDMGAGTVSPTIGTASRALAARFSDSLNVKDYGAAGDGTTDDTVAFQKAIAVATGRITSNGVFTAAEQVQLLVLNGVGPAGSGKSQIVVPPGRYKLSQTLIALLQSNNGFSMVGAGTGMTKLIWTMSGDGMDVTFAPTAAGNDTVSSPGTGYPGQAILISGIAFQKAFYGLTDPGVGLNITGIPLVNANVAPNQVIENVEFTTADGWIGYGQSWAVGLRFTDPDFLFMSHVRSIDLRQSKTAGFQMISDTPIGGTGHGEIVCEDCGSYGGSAFFNISGRGIQGVYLNRPYWLEVATGVTWLSDVQQNNGSFSIAGASGGASVPDVHLQNLGTIFSNGGFYYTSGATPVGSDWHGMWLDGVDWVNEAGDTITAPPAGSVQNTQTGGTYRAYGLLINQGSYGAGAYDPLPSVIAGVTVAGSDQAFTAQGPNVLLTGLVCSPNSATYGTTTYSTKCITDSYAGADQRFHPHWGTVVPADNIVIADAGNDEVYHYAPQHVFNGVKVGLPGVKMPSGTTGGAADIDFLASPSTDGTLSGLPRGTDVRLIAKIPAAGATADFQGGIDLYGAMGLDLHGAPLNAGLGTFLGVVTPDLEIGSPAATGIADGHIAGGNSDYDCRSTFEAGAATLASLAATPGLGTQHTYCRGGAIHDGPETAPAFNGALFDPSPVPIAITDGGTVTATDGTTGSVLVCPNNNTGATLAKETVLLPANPTPKDVFRVAAECNITTLVVGAQASAAGITPQVLGGAVAATPSTPSTYLYDNDRHLWIRW